MMTTSASTIEEFKREFFNRHANLPDHVRRQLWHQTISEPSGPPCQPADQVPRYVHPAMTDFSTSQFGSMDCIPSAPAHSTMERQLSVMDPNHVLTRSSSTMSNWQPVCDDQQPAYTFYPESAVALQPVNESTMLANSGMTVYSPSDYINNFMQSANPSAPFSFPQQPPQLHVPLTPSAQWSPQLDPSTSPSTPSTALMTPVTHSNNMSRQGSHNSHFLDDSSSTSMQFSESSVFPIPHENGVVSFPMQSKTINGNVDNLNFLESFTGQQSSDHFLSSAPQFSSYSCSSVANATAVVSSQGEPDLAEDMLRSASSSSESSASVSSPRSIDSRHARRDREINAQAVRCRIAPKASPSIAEIGSNPSNAQMVRIRSADGSCKNVGVITKAAYVRPQHPKIMCPKCNERPDGFRGTHELERHMARAHSAVRKGFICVDASPDKKFLSRCKHCRNGKVYGAYYNAAAHLRRTHFHPRERGGKKGKRGEEKRGGIGGGDDPPMDHLKQFWIRDVEVPNNATTVPQSPDTSSPSSSDDNNSTFESSNEMSGGYDAVSSFDINISTQQQQQQQQQSANDVPMTMPITVDPTTQYFDFDASSSTANTVTDMNICMPQVDASSFNPASTTNSTNVLYAAAATNDPTDIVNFQFDAQFHS
ncbi:hypothetical protein DM02DRAFT_151757 [Periconia macrospinosa]|uniref:DUF7896 domain-containing protein n=1 Tax=Periconia macrospinosa TaxID=97972 RepID=A0A2V1EEE5_9PLEO|nr:hypothetical protein DM02DRAFT_151757 [Periconia macrospinosa]